MSLPNYSIFFDGVDLASLDGVTVYNYKVNSLPARQLTMHKIANKDLTLLTRAEYSTKEIVVSAVICGDTRAEAEQKFLNLKTELQRINKALTVTQYGENINYTATLYSIADTWNVNEVDVVIIFTVSDPVGQASAVTTLIAGETITAQSVGTTATVAGSYPASPLIVATLNSGTGLTAQSMTLKNAATGQGITLTRDWTAGDVMSVDCENKIVAVNGALVDYSGAFPTFASGSATVGYLDTFTTRDVTLRVTYYKKYV